LAERLGSSPEALVGQPLTRIFRLEENEAGEMPLVTALAARHSFSDQPAQPRSGEAGVLMLSGEVMFSPDGSFDGFSGRALAAGEEPRLAAVPARLTIDAALDEALRSPLDRIIECAERIADRGDGPLRSDYAAYASDISAAARHLLSVIHSMSEEPAGEQRSIDLAALAQEAVVLVQAAAEARDVSITLEASRRLRASGEERAVIQVLVNLIGNAVRHSPRGGTVTIRFSRGSSTVCVIVADEGPGIAPADQQRIFERFERAGADTGGTGLGLAISRRLARSMGGDITVDSTPPSGSRFTLALPAA
jgi:signal transduction histidine kinase